MGIWQSSSFNPLSIEAGWQRNGENNSKWPRRSFNPLSIEAGWQRGGPLENTAVSRSLLEYD